MEELVEECRGAPGGGDEGVAFVYVVLVDQLLVLHAIVIAAVVQGGPMRLDGEDG